MSRKIVFALLLLLMVMGSVQAQTQPEAGTPGLGDPAFPLLGNGGYDALHYTIDLTVDMSQQTIAGTVTMQAKAAENLSAFDLDFGDLDISKITVNNSPAKYSHHEHELTITPFLPLATDKTFTTVVSYSGAPGVTQAYDVFAGGWYWYDGGVYVASEPNGAENWFPVNDHPLDKASYTIQITVPKPYVVAANGLLKDTRDNGTTTTYLWDTQYPLASYLVAVNIANFAVQTDQGPNGLPIRNYFPQEIADQGKTAFAQTADMIDYFSSVFGPFPFEAYGAAVADVGLSFALETQTLTLFGKEIVDPNSWGGSGGPQIVIAHELSHEWFGDSVSLSKWQDVWLNEGFATYAEALWTEHLDGDKARDDLLRGWYNVITSPQFSAGSVVPPGNPPPDDLFNTGVYLRGGWTLHALRLKVGDTTFFNILRTYYDRHKYSNATTADFIDVAQEVSQSDLSQFFNAWLYAPKVPAVPEMGLGESNS